MENIGLNHFLFVSSVLFILGLAAIILRKNAIMVLMGVELVLNSANINFVAYSRFLGLGISGHINTLIVIVLAAAEAAIGLAIVLNLYRLNQNINVDEFEELKN
ncbi:MAG TPA: NADH-quinone oxidoreductase subunit NuoK [Ignavibacteriales bacterium]|nr:NADH-quinone oxidoreductase subunit NuoK [Ignavibacteriales bacterium]HOL82307.1 NADH-quinone oxidoreductase subunit NuoK [Ignavibacteriales bacterium]HOM66336.1 NADH-quinone oxidoreductase subunit NuoK [Ignavibacteriales bacterium]HPP34520.1 NADH-quinone oxidoreductase subunit NuoK [Ignavibacteriales bacterium]HRR19686.1 NADH-quinone oxidoreductase subunit NuoK [Ignavibacteriales bacterium]